jgi:hypothetical protein
LPYFWSNNDNHFIIARLLREPQDALYENLDWLAGAQATGEDRLFAPRTKTKPVGSVANFAQEVVKEQLPLSVEGLRGQ